MLLRVGEVTQAVEWAAVASTARGEDVRSAGYAARVLAGALAAAGRTEEAERAAGEAVDLAYRTQQTSERESADRVRAEIRSEVF